MNIFQEFDTFNNNEYVSIKIIENALIFISNKFRHNGKSGMPKDRSIDSIISFAKKNKNEINCRLLSIILMELLNYKKIKCTHITCLPKEEFYNECHVVVEAQIDVNKRIMIDPSFNLYFLNELNEFVSVKDFKYAILNNKMLFPCNMAKHNNEIFDINWYTNFMKKLVVRFQRPIPYNAKDNENRLQLWDQNYNWKHEPIGFFVTRNEDEFWNF